MPGLGLTGPRAARRGASDRGAATMLFAFLAGGGVLFGMAAIVVDVGLLYAEREQLASGADAAAWAIAETCATDPDACLGDQAVPREIAERYANANAADGASAVQTICGDAPDPVLAAALGSCPAPLQDRTDCLGDRPTDVSYVEVRTRVQDGLGGATVLPSRFARLLTGDDDGAAVEACARAAWGAPLITRGLALTFSLCEWVGLTGEHGYGPMPGQGEPSGAAEVTLELHGRPDHDGDHGRSGGCGGMDNPGAFGWLDDPAGACETVIAPGGTYGGNAGLWPPRHRAVCESALNGLAGTPQITYLPIFNDVLPGSPGANTRYRLEGFAAFVLTGYRLSGAVQPSWLDPARDCPTPGSFCVFGYFVRGLLPTTGVEIGGPDMGLSIVNLVG